MEAQNIETGEMTAEVRLRRRVEEAMSKAYASELEEILKTLTPEEIDGNIFLAQLEHKELSEGKREASQYPADRAWEAHILEYGDMLFAGDPYDPPSAYTYEMALGYGRFCERWEAARTFLGRALARVFEEAGRLGLLDDSESISKLRQKVVEEVIALGARSIVKSIAEPETCEEPLVVKSPILPLDVNPALGYSREDVHEEAYGRPIGKLKASDLVPILDTSELPEICRIIHIMRLLGRTRQAIYMARFRMSNLELEGGGRGIPLGEWDVPKPIGTEKRQMTWSKSEVIRWKMERERLGKPNEK